MGINCDFSGWATRNDLLCGDGRTIRKDAFAQNDGCQVPLVWNHKHDDVNAVLGHAVLENRPDGVYAYGVFNDSPQGQKAKNLVQNGDVRSLSIWANELKQIGGDVIHGNIRELSLVLAGANPGAYVDFVMAHSTEEEDSLYASWDENIMLHHSADEEKGDSKMDGNNKPEEKKKDVAEKPEENKERTIQDVIDTMNKEQQDVLYGLLAMTEGDDDDDDSEGGDNSMKHNLFDKNNETAQQNVLSHSDEMAIVALAKQSGVGSLQQAMTIYAEENKDTLSHGIFDDSVEELFPEYELLKKGEPETLERDQSWIGSVISKIHKSPISRIRTRQADARIAELRASGYQKKGNYKHESEQIKLLSRTTDPQTIYIKDTMHRDDVVDITDFDVVAYQWNMMRHVLDEEMAMAALVGDGRDDGDPDKIHEDHIRSVWHDDELYTIHQVVDLKPQRQSFRVQIQELTSVRTISRQRL